MTRGWWRHTAMVLTAVMLFMAAAALANWPWWEFAFHSDMSPVSWLSGALLLANTAVYVTVLRVERRAADALRAWCRVR
jgi:hypothetical protein